MTSHLPLRAVALVALLFVAAAAADAATPGQRVCTLGESSYLLLDEAGEPLDACRADTLLIPASTLKLVTAWLALSHWGEDYRFTTDFFLDDDQRLWVRGSGDPMLVSEELDRIAAALAKSGLESLRGIGVDESRFAATVKIPGRSATDNPYDAPVAALAANFNTVNLARKGGRLHSAEPQTPLTPIALRLGATLRGGPRRINLRRAADSAVYFAELLASKLRLRGIEVAASIERGVVPPHAKLLLAHSNSRPLGEIVRAMLRYSNNFIANMLLLDLGAEAYGPPATMEKGVRHARRRIDEVFGWRDYQIVDGAGLSRDNRLSARQLTELLQRFAPWRSLLPERAPGIRAKTGTLRGIRSLAGYLEVDGGWRPFAILINVPAPRRLHFGLAERWRDLR